MSQHKQQQNLLCLLLLKRAKARGKIVQRRLQGSSAAADREAAAGVAGAKTGGVPDPGTLTGDHGVRRISRAVKRYGGGERPVAPLSAIRNEFA